MHFDRQQFFSKLNFRLYSNNTRMISISFDYVVVWACVASVPVDDVSDGAFSVIASQGNRF